MLVLRILILKEIKSILTYWLAVYWLRQFAYQPR